MRACAVIDLQWISKRKCSVSFVLEFYRSIQFIETTTAIPNKNTDMHRFRWQFLWISTTNVRIWSRIKIKRLCNSFVYRMLCNSFCFHCIKREILMKKMGLSLPLCWPLAEQWGSQHVMPIELAFRRLELIEMPCLHRNCTSRWMIELSNGRPEKNSLLSLTDKCRTTHASIVCVWLLLLLPHIAKMMMHALEYFVQNVNWMRSHLSVVVSIACKHNCGNRNQTESFTWIVWMWNLLLFFCDYFQIER